MAYSRILIQYTPQLYADILKHVLLSQGQFEIYNHRNNSYTDDDFDVIILSLEQFGNPGSAGLPPKTQSTKIIVFAPNGGFGLRRQPGVSEWEILKPFSIAQLLQELALEPGFTPVS